MTPAFPSDAIESETTFRLLEEPSSALLKGLGR